MKKKIKPFALQLKKPVSKKRIVKKNLTEKNRLKIVEKKGFDYSKIEKQYYKRSNKNISEKEIDFKKYKIKKKIKSDYTKRSRNKKYEFSKNTIVRVKIKGRIGRKDLSKIINTEEMIFNLKRVNHRYIRNRIYSRLKMSGYIFKYGEKDDNIMELQKAFKNVSVKNWSIKYDIEILEKRKPRKGKKK